ncbi:hypothetical protein ACWEJX_16815, partial [Streptomyces sp. NPDC004788]
MVETGAIGPVTRPYAGPAASQSTERHAPTPDASASFATHTGTGQACDLVTVPARQGLEAVDILRRADRLGAGALEAGAGAVEHPRLGGQAPGVGAERGA